MKNHRSGPHSNAIGRSVAITSGCAVIFFLIAVGFAKNYYRSAHNLAPIDVGFWIFTSYKKAPVTLGQLGAATILALLALTAVYGLVVHPVLGRLIQMWAESLTKKVALLYDLEDQSLRQWEPDVAIVFGSAWPVTVLSIPLLLIALVGGLVYRALWRWPNT